MTIIPKIIDFAETAPLSDNLLNLGINFLVRKTRSELKKPLYSDKIFAEQMQSYPIATHSDAANQQHYEVPARFFELCLGKNRKYSSCLYDSKDISLERAENRALFETCIHADLHDGQTILELGCGWGSLSLYMARNYPNSEIISVSNSNSQRQYIEKIIAHEGIKNLKIITADMNDFGTDTKFDRVVSVEMFEHMANWRELLRRVKTWLKPDGALFIHIFTHKNCSYRFSADAEADWIGKYFFSGGIMPSQNLLHNFSDLFVVVGQWAWNGENYQRTADQWLENFDRNEHEIAGIFAETYGAQKDVWMKRWRLFFLATAGLFGFDKGNEWFISHYLLRPA